MILLRLSKEARREEGKDTQLPPQNTTRYEYGVKSGPRLHILGLQIIDLNLTGHTSLSSLPTLPLKYMLSLAINKSIPLCISSWNPCVGKKNTDPNIWQWNISIWWKNT